MKAPKVPINSGRGQEIRQGGVDAVVDAGQVVADLVRQQDGQQRERERQAADERRGVGEDLGDRQQVVGADGPVALEIIGQARAHGAGGQNR